MEKNYKILIGLGIIGACLAAGILVLKDSNNITAGQYNNKTIEQSNNVQPPIILNITATPEKVVPGNMMTIEAEIQDEKGIKEVTAEVFHDLGSDKVNLSLISGDIHFGKWQGKWSVHNTRPIKYDLIVTAFSQSNLKTARTIQYLDPGWLSNYGNRKQITIAGTADGAQSNYQMKLTIYKSTGTDATSNVYLGTKIRDDFADIRFTKADGSTLLDYWVESTTTASSSVWIEFDSIPAAAANITFQEGWETFTGTAGDNIGDNWNGWTEDPVNSGIDDARTGGQVGTYCIALRPSVAAPTNSYGRIFTTDVQTIGDQIKFWVKKNESGSNSWARFRLLNSDNTTYQSWDITPGDTWSEVTISVSAYKGVDKKLCLEAGTNVAGYGYATLFDDFRHTDLVDSTTTFYIYYNYASATSASNEQSTFGVLNHGVETGSFANWTTVADLNTPFIDTVNVWKGTYSGACTCEPDSGTLRYPGFYQNIVVPATGTPYLHFWRYRKSTKTWYCAFVGLKINDVEVYDFPHSYVSSDYTAYSGESWYDLNSYKGQTIKVFFGFKCQNTDNGSTLRVDDVYITHQGSAVSPEPTWSTWGSEETASAWIPRPPGVSPSGGGFLMF